MNDELELQSIYNKIVPSLNEQCLTNLAAIKSNYPECFSHQVSKLDEACDLIKRSELSKYTTLNYVKSLRQMVRCAIQANIIEMPEGFEIRTTKNNKFKLITPAYRQDEINRAQNARLSRGATTKLSTKDRPQKQTPTKHPTQRNAVGMINNLQLKYFEWKEHIASLERDHSQENITATELLEHAVLKDYAILRATWRDIGKICDEIEDTLCHVLKLTKLDLLKKDLYDGNGFQSLEREVDTTTVFGSQPTPLPISSRLKTVSEDSTFQRTTKAA